MSLWERGDQIVQLLDDGMDETQAATTVGVKVSELYRFERVARLFPRKDRAEGVAFSTYQVIAEACIGSPDKPDPIRTMKAFLAEPGPHTGDTARTWFAKRHRTIRRSRRRAKVRAVPAPPPVIGGWSSAWTAVRCDECQEVMCLRPDVAGTVPAVWCASCAAAKYGVTSSATAARKHA